MARGPEEYQFQVRQAWPAGQLLMAGSDAGMIRVPADECQQLICIWFQLQLFAEIINKKNKKIDLKMNRYAE